MSPSAGTACPPSRAPRVGGATDPHTPWSAATINDARCESPDMTRSGRVSRRRVYQRQDVRHGRRCFRGDAASKVWRASTLAWATPSPQYPALADARVTAGMAPPGCRGPHDSFHPPAAPRRMTVCLVRHCDRQAPRRADDHVRGEPLMRLRLAPATPTRRGRSVGGRRRGASFGDFCERAADPGRPRRPLRDAEGEVFSRLSAPTDCS